MLLKNKYPTIVSLHYVSDDKSMAELKPWSISCASYTRFLDYLTSNQYTTLGFEDIINEQYPKKSIIITFDDCPKHLWEYAIPELQKRNMKAVFYLPTAHLGGNNEWNASDGITELELMNREDIKRLTEIGMEVGSHSHRHIMLSEQPTDVVVEELSISKSIIESIIRKPVISVAYPYGDVPGNHKGIAQEVGYSFGLSVFTRFESKYSLRRWTYEDADDVKTIKWKMSFGYRYYRAFDDNGNIIGRKVLAKLYKMYINIRNSFSAYLTFVTIYVNDLECL